MKRRQFGQLVDLLNDVLVDEYGFVEVAAALHNAVADGVDFVQRIDGLGRAGSERLEHERHGLVVVGHLGVDHFLVLVDTVLVEGVRRAHALADALGEHLVLFDIDELVLERRGACVNYKNVQSASLEEVFN